MARLCSGHAPGTGRIGGGIRQAVQSAAHVKQRQLSKQRLVLSAVLPWMNKTLLVRCLVQLALQRQNSRFLYLQPRFCRLPLLPAAASMTLLHRFQTLHIPGSVLLCTTEVSAVGQPLKLLPFQNFQFTLNLLSMIVLRHKFPCGPPCAKLSLLRMQEGCTVRWGG